MCSDRWVHAVCESLYTEDEVEQASDEGFACTYCAPYVPKPVGKSKNVIKTQHSMSELFLLFFYLPFLHSSRVSHHGFNKDQGAR